MNFIEENLSFSNIMKCIVLLILVVIIGFMGFSTTMSADDYWYATFLDDTSSYMDLLVEHYQTFNGRVIVHMFAQIVLHFGMGLFALVCVALTAAIPLLSAASNEEVDYLGVSGKLSICVVFMSLVLLLPRAFMTDGFLWVSAFCNYVLPTAMLSLEIYLLGTYDSDCRIWKKIFMILFFFTCGATTEQSGIVSMIIAAVFIIEAFIKDYTNIVMGMSALVMSSAGLLTIFLSPATQSRYDLEVGSSSESFLMKAMHGLESEAKLLINDSRIYLMIAVLFFMIGLFYLLIIESRLGFGLSFIPIIIVFVAHFILKDADSVSLYVVLMAGAGFAISLIFFTDYGQIGYFLGAGVVSACSILCTKSIGERTLLPFCMYIAVVIAILFAVMIEDQINAELIILYSLVLVSTICVFQDLPHYWYNHKIENLNREYAKEAVTTGELYYCMDYDEDYTYHKMYTERFFYDTYLDYVGVDPDKVKVYIYSDHEFAVYAGGERITEPAFKDDGEYYVSVRSLIEGMGGTVDYDGGYVTMKINGKEAFYSSGKSDFIYVDNKNFECHLKIDGTIGKCSGLALPVSVLQNVFGFDVEIDTEKMRIDINLPQ